MANIQAIITKIADQYGVNPNLAIADASVESNLNPTAVGDNGTSFGLFQLHRGGELGNLTPQQAFNPVTNASVALAQFAAVQKANPGLTDPGVIAALAQRPANPVAYAQAVDAKMGLTSTNVATELANAGGPTYSTAGTPSSSGGSGGGSIPLFSTPVGSIGISSQVLVRGVLLFMGLFVLYAGIKGTFTSKDPIDIVTSTGKSLGDKARDAGTVAA